MTMCARVAVLVAVGLAVLVVGSDGAPHTRGAAGAAAAVPMPAAHSAHPTSASGPASIYPFAGRGSAEAVGALLDRLLGSGTSALFDLQMTDSCGARTTQSNLAPRSSLCFELSDATAEVAAAGGPLISVRGTSGVEIAYGCAHYLRKYCNMSFSWKRAGGDQVC